MSFQIGKNIEQGPKFDDEFSRLMNCAQNKLEKNFKIQDFSWQKFEEQSFCSINASLKELNYPWNIEYISGSNRFPDIVAKINSEKSIGIEIKTLKRNGNRWKILGGSIMETTKIPGLERIFVFCAKPNPLEMKLRPFEDCVCDVSVTHSPRYVLNMEQSENESLFKKLKSSYNDISQMDNPFDAFRDFLIKEKRERQQKNKKDSGDFWWCPQEIIGERELPQEKFATSYIENQLIFWNDLSSTMKKYYTSVLLSRFPELFFGEYKNAARYLLKEFFVINPSFRDTFSAGGKIIENGIKVPKVFGRLYELRDNIPEYWSKTTFTQWRQKFDGYKISLKKMFCESDWKSFLSWLNDLLNDIESRLNR